MHLNLVMFHLKKKRMFNIKIILIINNNKMIVVVVDRFLNNKYNHKISIIFQTIIRIVNKANPLSQNPPSIPFKTTSNNTNNILIAIKTASITKIEIHKDSQTLITKIISNKNKINFIMTAQNKTNTLHKKILYQ
jgi:hypothetical protein